MIHVTCEFDPDTHTDTYRLILDRVPCVGELVKFADTDYLEGATFMVVTVTHHENLPSVVLLDRLAKKDVV